MALIEKQFVLRHVFRNLSNMTKEQKCCGTEEDHFNVPWKLYIVHTNEDKLGTFLWCNKRLNGEEWEIEAECEMRIVTHNGMSCCNSGTFYYGTANNNKFLSFGWRHFLSWTELEKDFIVNDRIILEARVTIKKMTGIAKKEKEKLRNFDESLKQFSDVVLIVNEERFYVLKQFLAIHSTFFKSLFFGDFKEANQSEVTLSGIQAPAFQKYLETVYGDSAIDDDTVEDVCLLADMYDTSIVTRKCEEFLCKESKMALKKRLELARRFRMENLKEKCVSEVKSLDDLHEALPIDMDELDHATATALLQKFYALY